MASITGGASVITPTTVLEFTSSREGRTNIHDVLNRANPDVTLRLAGSRKGHIKLAFLGADSEQKSAAAEAILSERALFTYVTDPERPSLSLSFVIPDGGQITRALDDDTRDDWTVEFDYREVSP